jgi:hypothetical protein
MRFAGSWRWQSRCPDHSSLPPSPNTVQPIRDAGALMQIKAPPGLPWHRHGAAAAVGAANCSACVLRSSASLWSAVHRATCPIVGHRKMWRRIAKLGDPPADISTIASPVSRPISASTNRRSHPCWVTRRTRSPADTYTPPMSRFCRQPMHVANATMKLIASGQAQPQLRDQGRDGSDVWDEFTVL